MKISILVLGLFMTSLLQSESFEEFMAEMNNDYKSFVTQMDKDFAQALGKEWKEFDSNIKPSYQDPKPIVIPSAPVQPIKQPDNNPIINIIIVNPPQRETPKLPTVPKVRQGYKKLAFNFFSQDITFVYNSKLNHSLHNFTNQSIANYWLTLSSFEINNFLTQIRTYKRKLNLNDWHLYLLVKDIGNLISEDSTNAKLLTWFLLNKLGYDVKLGMAHNEIYLISSNQI